MASLKIEFGPITADNIGQVSCEDEVRCERASTTDEKRCSPNAPPFLLFQLRKINAASFPVQYNEGFYQDVLKRNNEHLNKFAYYKGFVVGAVCARIEDAEDEKRLYLMTLAVLAAYRSRGIGSQLLQSLLDYCETLPAIRAIRLHVQISNDDAIRFYTERFDFVQGELVENYYRRIDPPHCYLLYKEMSVPAKSDKDEDEDETPLDAESSVDKAKQES